jgi:RNA polymerase sigma-70 factor (ECF subfamily)
MVVIELIKKYKSTGNLSHLGELYAPFMPFVYGVCLKYLKNRDLANDGVMNVFEKLVVELKRKDVPSNFKAWLYVVVKNYCLMYLRHNNGDANTTLIDYTEIVENEFHFHPMDVEYDTGQRHNALDECIEHLRIGQRRSVEMFYYEKQCYREIAEKLQLSEKKVKSNIQNGKRNLKICIDKKMMY